MKNLTLVLVLVVAVVGGWYVVAPRRAVDRLENAVRDADQAALDRVIDFESVRENMKTDLRSLLDANAQDRDNPLASFGAALGGMFTDGVVDTFVTPGGLASILSGRNPMRDNRRDDGVTDYEFDIERRSPLRFDAHVETDSDSDLGPVLQFHMDGIRWRVYRIELREIERRRRD